MWFRVLKVLMGWVKGSDPLEPFNAISTFRGFTYIYSFTMLVKEFLHMVLRSSVVDVWANVRKQPTWLSSNPVTWPRCGWRWATARPKVTFFPLTHATTIACARAGTVWVGMLWLGVSTTLKPRSRRAACASTTDSLTIAHKFLFKSFFVLRLMFS